MGRRVLLLKKSSNSQAGVVGKVQLHEEVCPTNSLFGYIFVFLTSSGFRRLSEIEAVDFLLSACSETISGSSVFGIFARASMIDFFSSGGFVTPIFLPIVGLRGTWWWTRSTAGRSSFASVTFSGSFFVFFCCDVGAFICFDRFKFFLSSKFEDLANYCRPGM
jgi:hypothetical protein